jgi:hypothetical protein
MKNKSVALRTFKIRYFCPDSDWNKYYLELARQQSNATRFAFNRFKDGLDKNQVYASVSALVNISIDQNNKEYVDPSVYQSIMPDAHFINSAVIYAEGIYKSADERGQKKLTFKQAAFDRYHKNEITKSELREARFFLIYSVGEANQMGNRKYNFLSFKTLEFKPKIHNKFKFYLSPTSNQEKYLKIIYELAIKRDAPVTIMLDRTHIYLTFDMKYIPSNATKVDIQENRVLGIDMNPNNFGFVIKDEREIFKAEKLDFMDLRLYTRKGFASDSDEKLYLNNKKDYEIIESAYYIVNQAEQFKCEAVSLEILYNMQSRGVNRHFNRAVNNDFKKKLFRNTIQKLCAERNIKFIEVIATYTSFYGYIKYNDILGDPCSAAACVADAGIIELERVVNSEKRIAWFKKVKIDKSLYKGNSFLNRWNETDLNFSSIKDLYESIKKLIAKGGMYKSYHISYQTNNIVWFKNQRSAIKREIYI